VKTLKNLISFQKSVHWSLILFGLLILFHLAIIGGMVFFDFVPLEFLWGGRLNTFEELLFFECISLAVSIFCLLTVLIRADILYFPGLKRLSRISLWLLFVLFALNTFGNFFARTQFEQTFALATAILAFLCLRMALEPVRHHREVE
jgi:hypothetical protein